MPLNVLQALCNPAFADLRLLSGWSGLDRIITSVTVAEVPDAANWLVGGELVLTTGYFVNHNSYVFEEWLDGLARGGAAAVAIKPQRFMGELPAKMVQMADRLGLPLVALPHNISWPMIIRPLTEAIIFSDTDQEDDHAGELVNLLKDRSGFTTVAESLSGLIGHPVIIEDAERRLLGLGLKNCINMNRQVIQERVPAPKPQLQQNPFWWLEAGDERSWLQREVILAEQTVHERIYRLGAGAHLRGYLSVLIQAELGPEQERTLQLWAAAVALGFDRLAAYRERPLAEARRLTLAVLRETGAPPPHPDPDIGRLFELYGAVVMLDTEGVNDLAGMHLVVRAEDGRPDLQAVNDVVLLLEQWVQSFDAHGTVIPFEAGVMLLVHPPSEKGAEDFLRLRVAELAQRVRDACGEVAVQIGVGEPGRGLEHRRSSLKQASQALAVAKTQAGAERVWFYRDLGIYRLLFRPEQMNEIRAETNHLLAPVLRADTERRADLIATLDAFFAEDGDWGRAAEKLYLHPNTLRYRLRQVERLTGLELRRLEDLLQLFLAVKVHRLQRGANQPPGPDPAAGARTIDHQ